MINYQLEDVIGQGAYATVYKGKSNKGETVAIKVIQNTDLLQEIQILRECEHPNIVQYKDSFERDGAIWLVMEYCMGGSVMKLMEVLQRSLNEQEISAILYQILQGLDYLHKNQKIHRDIKAGNILLDSNGLAKLGDFGVATQLTVSENDKSTFIGSPFWMSPEVLNKSRYNQTTDIWSLGVTAIEMAEGLPPYSHIHPVRAMFAIKKNPPQGLTCPNNWSNEFNSFVQACLNIIPNQRPTAHQLLSFPFVKLGKQRIKSLQLIVQENLQQLQIPSDPKESIVIEDHQQHNEPYQTQDESEENIIDYGTLVIKNVEQKVQKPILPQNLQEKKKLKQLLEQQMNDEIEQIKRKYLPQIQQLDQEIIKEDNKQNKPLNLPFSFQVSQEVLQQLANLKNTQNSKKSTKLPFEFIPKQK